MTWPVGEAEIRALIGKGELERVSPNPKHADRLLSEARASDTMPSIRTQMIPEQRKTMWTTSLTSWTGQSPLRKGCVTGVDSMTSVKVRG